MSLKSQSQGGFSHSQSLNSESLKKRTHSLLLDGSPYSSQRVEDRERENSRPLKDQSELLQLLLLLPQLQLVRDREPLMAQKENSRCCQHLPGRASSSLFPLVNRFFISDDLAVTSSQLFVCRSMASYMRELEVSPDRPPTKFRCRGRVGRGGRVVIDRVPVYDSDPDPSSHHSFFLPTQLPSLPAQLAHKKVAEFLSSSALTDQMVLSLRPSLRADGSTVNSFSDLSYGQLDEVTSVYSSYSSLPSYPLFFPPERPAVSCVATSEEREIYANSDSEDELLEVHATGASLCLSPFEPTQAAVLLRCPKSQTTQRSATPSWMCNASGRTETLL